MEPANPESLDESPGVFLRDALAADAAEIAGIYNATVDAHDATMDLLHRSSEYFADLIAGLQAREAFIVAQDGEGILGWGRIMRYSDREGYAAACETAVYIRRELRRQGYGTMIKRELIRRCRSLGYHHVVAKVCADNRSSIDYNLRLGYEIVGTQREIGKVRGEWRDVTIMQLILSGPAAPRIENE